MQPGGHDEGVQPDVVVGHGFGDCRFHPLFAAGAPVAVDDVFGDFRLGLGQVIDIPFAGLDRLMQRCLAKGAGFQRMFFVFVDVVGDFAGFAGMPLFASGFLLPFLFLVRLQVDGDGAGGGQGRRVGLRTFKLVSPFE